uniref:PB1 domain-containing protein n=1 Tax=Leersia perrieri TaxID=77586 RepID=A0A0D9X6E7_9ORYZ
MGKPSAAAAAADGDEEVFMELSRELKEEATRLFNRRDYEGAAFKYDKAVQLLPAGGGRAAAVEEASLRTCVARCYMRMSPAGEYHRAIHECNLALEAAPRYSRALLRRAACFQALDRPDLAWDDVRAVLAAEPANRAALEISEKVRAALEEKGVVVLEKEEAVTPPAPEKEEKERKKKAVGVKVKGKMKKSRQQCDAAIEEVQESIRVDDCEEGVNREVKINGQANGENHAEKMQLDSKHVVLDGKGGIQNDTKEANGVGKHQNHMEDKETNGLEKEDRNHKQGKHSAGKKIRRADAKKQKHSSMEPVHRADENRHEHCVKTSVRVEESVKDLKLVFGEDIRCAQMPANCDLSQLRSIVQNKFPSLKALLIKYKDKEGDLVTVTSSDELRWADSLADPEGPIRLYIVEVDPAQELGVDLVRRRSSFASLEKGYYSMSENGSTRHDDDQNSSVDDWMIQFARLFKNHIGFDSDSYLDLHDLGMRLYYEAMEDTVASEEAQEIFQVAELKFQEMAALALFNWGNVHMASARKRPPFSDDASMECILEQVKVDYEWACAEYAKAGAKYGEAVKTKPDFFEGLIALGQQQFEQAKLCWYYALACKIDMGTEVLGLFNHAEDNMEKGMEMWEGMENTRLRGLSKPNKEKAIFEKIGIDGCMKDMSSDEAFEQACSIRSHVNILWGTILYERSVVEFNLGLPSWEESLTVAMEKFKTGGASPADINVMVKNHCANETTQEGLSFKVEEIVQAWNEMYDAKKWRSGAPSSRLEPIFRRRAPKLHHILEHIHYA